MHSTTSAFIKEWKSKLAFLKEDLQYMLIKLQRLNTEIAEPQKHDYIESITERVIQALEEIKLKVTVLIEEDVEINEAALRDSLSHYEQIRFDFKALMNDDFLFEVA